MRRIIALFVIASVLSVPAVRACCQPDNQSESQSHKMTDPSDSDMLKLCQWIVATPPSDNAQQEKIRQTALTAMMQYVTETEKFSLALGNPFMKIMDVSGRNPASENLLPVYLAGEVIYCLEHNLKKNNADSFAYAIECVISQYSQLPEHTIEPLNRFMKMDAGKRQSELVKFYNKENGN